jgi:Uma2 family endonuclease
MQTVKEKKVKQRLPQPKKFTTRDIEKLYKLGFLKPDKKIELINGEIYKMSPIGLRHHIIVNRLNDLLTKIIHQKGELEEKYIVSVQNPLKLSSDNLPQPDIAILKRKYIEENRYPRPKDTELLIEVSDTTLSFDRNVKLTLYAKYKVPKVLIVNLLENQIEIYEKPKKNKYTEIYIKGVDDEIDIFGNKTKVKEILKLEGKK